MAAHVEPNSEFFESKQESKAGEKLQKINSNKDDFEEINVLEESHMDIVEKSKVKENSKIEENAEVENPVQIKEAKIKECQKMIFGLKQNLDL